MMIATPAPTALADAVKAAGSQSAFGRLIGRRQSTVRDWLVAGKELPAEYVLRVEAELGMSRHVLRPDIYPVVDHGLAPIPTSAIAPNGNPVKCPLESIAA
jgi:DNA-binding transcriptional regulator YdaS (Cro superfamily)